MKNSPYTILRGIVYAAVLRFGLSREWREARHAWVRNGGR
jgi:hypothetical protein